MKTATMNVREIRQKKGCNQSVFWSQIGVTQSGGSRFETGRVMSKPVQMLFDIAHGSKKDRQKVLKQLGVEGA